MDLNDLLSNIAKGNFVKPSDILPFLCSETKEERCRVNAKLASAYSENKNFQKAKIFIQRAWVLSDFSPDLLPLYLKIHSSLGDISSIQEAYKRLGMKKASERKIADAIKYFNSSMYAYANYQKLDQYKYDFDILEQIEKLAAPYRFEPSLQQGPLTNRKIRLAYLTFGMMHVNSVIAKINRMFAKFHDKSRFEVTFFIPEPKKELFDFGQAKDNIRIFMDSNCKVVAPNSDNEEERLLEVANHIFNYHPDVLITNALLADLNQYFIASLRPAPIIIGLVQGPPPQFASYSLDWGIAWKKHPLIDCPCDCSLVDLEIELPEQNGIKFYTKQQLNIPEDGFILMSGGRTVKFQEPAFWSAIFDIMHNHPNVYYVVVGAKENDIPFLQAIFPVELKSRLSFFGWRADFLKILGLADIVLDTFPSGGGLVLMDAMALGIPVVSFKNNYMKLFDQTDWSPAEEFIDIPDLLVERGNFKQLKNVLSKLITDQTYRTEMARLCREHITMTRGKPERMVRICEDIYGDVLKKKLEHVEEKGTGKDQPSVVHNLRKIELIAMSFLGRLRGAAMKMVGFIRRISS